MLNALNFNRSLCACISIALLYSRQNEYKQIKSLSNYRWKNSFKPAIESAFFDVYNLNLIVLGISYVRSFVRSLI